MARPEPDFSMDELFRQLQAELATTEEGWTTTELVEALGVSRGAVVNRLKQLKTAGLLMLVRKRLSGDRTLDGRSMTVTAYRLKPKQDHDAGDGDSEGDS